MKTPTLILVLGLALIRTSFAVDPPPDGGYPNRNTAEGENALLSLTTGVDNTAVGFEALTSNITGGSNTAIGLEALTSNTTGSENTATGWMALLLNTTGNGNTASGLDALVFNSTGNENTASGLFALSYNTTGNRNTACGSMALLLNMTGSNNIALGAFAGTALTTGDNNIDIGNEGITSESRTIRIGITGTQRATYIAGISGAPVATGVDVVIDSTGRLGTRVSSRRFKEGVQPMAKSSEAILSLKPVTFRYKEDLDPNATPQFGLVAEDVAKVDPDLVARDEEGKPYTVRYEAVNAMLLNEFLKEHKKVEEQTKGMEAQAKEIAELKSALKEVTARLDAKGL